jgi:hypothetical protein
MRGDWLSQYGQEPTDPRFDLEMVAFFAGFPLGGENASLGSAFPPTSVDGESQRGGGFGFYSPEIKNISFMRSVSFFRVSEIRDIWSVDGFFSFGKSELRNDYKDKSEIEFHFFMWITWNINL